LHGPSLYFLIVLGKKCTTLDLQKNHSSAGLGSRVVSSHCQRQAVHHDGTRIGTDVIVVMLTKRRRTQAVPVGQPTGLARAPDAILIYLLGFLDCELDVTAIAQTSHALRHVACSDAVWKRFRTAQLTDDEFASRESKGIAARTRSRHPIELNRVWLKLPKTLGVSGPIRLQFIQHETVGQSNALGGQGLFSKLLMRILIRRLTSIHQSSSAMPIGAKAFHELIGASFLSRKTVGNELGPRAGSITRKATILGATSDLNWWWPDTPKACTDIMESMEQYWTKFNVEVAQYQDICRIYLQSVELVMRILDRIPVHKCLEHLRKAVPEDITMLKSHLANLTDLVIPSATKAIKAIREAKPVAA
jgi:hypothetical protein